MIIRNYLLSFGLEKYCNAATRNIVAALLLVILILLRIEHHPLPLWLSTAADNSETYVPEKNKNNIKGHQTAELKRLHLFSAETTDAADNPYRVGYLAADDPLLFHAPRSSLTARVVGVLTSSIHEKSIAIIEQNKRQSSYSQGEKLPENHAVVIKIFDDRVILNHQGYYESLLLD
ncbi:type II secretion system protein N [Yersinia artesiana]|uniref:type II secretion system protein N n=1 Tax=Yersinia artesiana TaxID=2890315 RepID=UPI001D123F53|nr:type II secretion system protein N [Yersinia artesiana]